MTNEESAYPNLQRKPPRTCTMLAILLAKGIAVTQNDLAEASFLYKYNRKRTLRAHIETIRYYLGRNGRRWP